MTPKTYPLPEPEHETKQPLRRHGSRSHSSTSNRRVASGGFENAVPSGHPIAEKESCALCAASYSLKDVELTDGTIIRICRGCRSLTEERKKQVIAGWWTLSQAAEVVGLSQTRVRMWAERGLIDGVDLDKHPIRLNQQHMAQLAGLANELLALRARLAELGMKR